MTKIFTLLPILFLSLFCFVNSRYTPKPFIVGGSYAKYGQFPYHAQLVDDSMYHNYYCGGGIIGSRWVVTLAQCTFGKTLRKINIVIGEIYLAPHWELYYAMSNVIHPAYNNVTKANNVAVVKVDVPFKFDIYAQPLPVINREVSVEELLVFSGWGSDVNNEASDVLVYVENFSKLTTDKCKEIYEDFSNDTICANRRLKHTS